MTATDSGYNLFGDNSKTTANALRGFTANGTDTLVATSNGTNVVLASVLNTSLAQNGAATGMPLTHALVTGSPALNAGDPSFAGATVVAGKTVGELRRLDQRNFGHINNDTRRDIGAFEANGVALPAAPTGLTATPGNTQVSLAFTAPSDNGGFPITNYQYSTDNGATYATVNPASTASPVVITGLTNGTAYPIKLRALVAESGMGVESAAVNATPAPPNAAPVASNVAITGTAQVGTQLTGSYTYNDAENNAEGTSTFRWVRNSTPTVNVATTQNYTPVTADVGNSLQFCVTPKASAGTLTGTEVCSSATAAILKAPQTIAFGTAPSLVVGGTGTVSATGGASGNAVVFSSQTADKCTVVGSTVTAVATGTCTIAANQEGNAGYLAAGQVTQTITVAAPAPVVEPPPPPPVVEQGSRTSVSSGVVEVRPTASATQAPGELSVRGSVQMQLGGTSSTTIAAQSVGDAPAQIRFTQTPNGTLVPSVQSGTVVFTVPTGATGGTGGSTGGSGTPRPVLPIATQPPGADTATPRMVTTTDVPCSNGSTTLRVAVETGTGASTGTGTAATSTTRVDVGGCPVNLVGADGSTATPRQQARADAVTTTATDTHTGTTVYPGEQMVLDANNKLIAIQLGSTDASATTLAGADVGTPSATGLSVNSFTPRLAGTVTRLGQDLAQLVSAPLKAIPGVSDFLMVGEAGRIVLTHNGQRHLFSAIGRVHVNTDLTPARTASAQGGVVLNSGGVAVEFVPSVLGLGSLAQAVTQDGGSLVAQADGSYIATLSGVPHAMKATSGLQRQAGGTATGASLVVNSTAPGNTTSNTTSNAAGNPQGVQLTLNQPFGYRQTLVAAAADLAGLKALAQQADAAAKLNAPLALEGQDSSIELTLGGQTYRLQPEMALVKVPADKANQAFWMEQGKLFVAVPSQPGWAQVFNVR